VAANNFESVDDYIASQPEVVQTALDQVRAAIRKALPNAEEVISYNIPTYKLHGSALLYFAGWKKHYSLYPAGQRLVRAFQVELSAYDVKNSTLRFPLSKPVPLELIERIAKFRVEESTARDRKVPARASTKTRAVKKH
jgi:uncharacterized protein YdhG (YjbR/CyaY superfamily)